MWIKGAVPEVGQSSPREASQIKRLLPHGSTTRLAPKLYKSAIFVENDLTGHYVASFSYLTASTSCEANLHSVIAEAVYSTYVCVLLNNISEYDVHSVPSFDANLGVR